VAVRYPNVLKQQRNRDDVCSSYSTCSAITLNVYREELKIVIKREEEYRFDKKLVNEILWKHCSFPLQSLIRGTEGYDKNVQDENLVAV
jgi:hypothetical protein